MRISDRSSDVCSSDVQRQGGMPKMRWILPLSSILQANLGLNPRFHLRNPLMRIYLTAGVLIGRLAGCSSADQAPVAGKAAAAAGERLAGALDRKSVV